MLLLKNIRTRGPCAPVHPEYGGRNVLQSQAHWGAANNRLSGLVFRQHCRRVIANKVGAGKVIVFASNPFTQSAISDQTWKDFFKAFAKDLGLKVDRDIWRFEYPPYKTVAQPDSKGVCLTGNNVKFWMDVPTYPHNLTPAGTYRYSIRPDGVSDRGSAWIPFSSGKLTDRKKAYTTPTTKLNPDDFSVTWKTEKPIDITFDLQSSKTVSRASFWYSGQLPSVRVFGSTDGSGWTEIGSHPSASYARPDGINSHEDVLDVSIEGLNRRVRYIKLSFGSRDAGNPFTLAECEIWGSSSKR